MLGFANSPDTPWCLYILPLHLNICPLENILESCVPLIWLNAPLFFLSNWILGILLSHFTPQPQGLCRFSESVIQFHLYLLINSQLASASCLVLVSPSWNNPCINFPMFEITTWGFYVPHYPNLCILYTQFDMDGSIQMEIRGVKPSYSSDVVFCEYVLLPLVNKELALVNGRAE